MLIYVKADVLSLDLKSVKLGWNFTSSCSKLKESKIILKTPETLNSTVLLCRVVLDIYEHCIFVQKSVCVWDSWEVIYTNNCMFVM